MLPYLKDNRILVCPSNAFTYQRTGDESNPPYTLSDYLPNSYAYNGTFFHEPAPCDLGESTIRPRRLVEVHNPANRMIVLESCVLFPDLGSWTFPDTIDPAGKKAVFSSTTSCATDCIRITMWRQRNYRERARKRCGRMITPICQTASAPISSKSRRSTGSQSRRTMVNLRFFGQVIP